jgi:hypothetical protein
MPKYIVNFFITYWKKGKEVQFHSLTSAADSGRGVAMSTNPSSTWQKMGRVISLPPF